MSWSDDRCRSAAEESPGSNGSERQVTPGGRESTESAAENIPPTLSVRVKWCGKSAPRGR